VWETEIWSSVWAEELYHDPGLQVATDACDVYDKLAAEGMMAITNLLYLKNSSLLAYISLLPVIDFRDATKLT